MLIFKTESVKFSLNNHSFGKILSKIVNSNWFCYKFEGLDASTPTKSDESKQGGDFVERFLRLGLFGLVGRVWKARNQSEQPEHVVELVDFVIGLVGQRDESARQACSHGGHVQRGLVDRGEAIHQTVASELGQEQNRIGSLTLLEYVWFILASRIFITFFFSNFS